jgi:hypothetical protein
MVSFISYFLSLFFLMLGVLCLLPRGPVDGLGWCLGILFGGCHSHTEGGHQLVTIPDHIIGAGFEAAGVSIFSLYSLLLSLASARTLISHISVVFLFMGAQGECGRVR